MRMKYCRRGHALTGANLSPHYLKQGDHECRACLSTRNFFRDLPGPSDRVFQSVADTHFMRSMGWILNDRSVVAAAGTPAKWSRHLTETHPLHAA